MSKLFEVAKYILENTGEITTMKLQKLVYYSQAWSLAWDGKPLFDEEFQAWANGPVCPELFRKHQGQFVISKNMFKDLECNFTYSEKETIDAVLRHYGDKDSHWLSELTHQENPWKDARRGLNPGEGSNATIEKESMQSYYGSL